MMCPRCGFSITPTTQYCPQCGTFIASLSPEFSRSAPPKKNSWKAIITAVIIGSVLLCGITNIVFRPTPPPAPSAHVFNGQGNVNTDLFSVSGPTIEIDYQCEPSAMGNFVIVVYNDAGGELGIPVNTNCNSGSTRGTAQLNASGSIYLSVTAMGNWSITVKG